jgi:hypothetical protein
MGKKILPAYPERDKTGASVTVAVRMSAMEAIVLDYMASSQPNYFDHSRGGLLRSMFRGCVRPAGLIVPCSNVKELRSILRKKSLLQKEEQAEVSADRVIVVMDNGSFVIGAPLVVSEGLDFQILGSGSTEFEFQGGSEDSVDLSRFHRCRIVLVSVPSAPRGCIVLEKR